MIFEPSLAFAMGANGAEGQGNPITAFIPLIVMFAIFYFLLIRPQQKKAKQHREVLGNLKKGDRVITAGGLYGRIHALNDDILTLEIGDNVKVQTNRNYIAGLAETETRPVSKEPK
ncbi:preprotein translocase subunit YajC [Desulfonatronum thiosulfatophilum]|uniref:Sec translocon accessory complex subunit YajC n=1 Tax=Desulfonatronum thiosulfatophilum TaxID=617002 RepID=A0A1G6E963_9BACT|nr:preprotein translocase subunit YajC [Desulfonatronum thiosulfatophilum]SDB53951.1 preprotein translocase subunit YajC [Desulfonatronum thiosulfatophilum]